MNRQTELEALLSELSKEELIQLLVQAASGDERLKNSLMIRYSKTDQDHAGQVQSFKQLVESTVNRFTGKKGRIPYRENGPFAQEFYNLLADANLAEDDLLAFELTLVIVEEGGLAVQYTDNSDGAFWGLVEDAIQQLEEIAESLQQQDISVPGNMAKQVRETAQSDVFADWEDLSNQLLSIADQLTPKER